MTVFEERKTEQRRAAQGKLSIEMVETFSYLRGVSWLVGDAFFGILLAYRATGREIGVQARSFFLLFTL
ncbi:hypothetical protein [Candidatus Methylacidithermus pantelleriae]|uniref:Uncharacterized protein n=1 Tax=Candidatus Methylacidithermus pantelleriae TaxID=2744239 RepID=A0A8J2FNK7_9BACT|nr:hypothetical protein [Candidatus Methylacidithermus pantelleriae]CAF0693438.1 hypothetical protein MPNT_140002 [Candidatus Methylacidithermus pantelleriae]